MDTVVEHDANDTSNQKRLAETTFNQTCANKSRKIDTALTDEDKCDIIEKILKLDKSMSEYNKLYKNHGIIIENYKTYYEHIVKTNKLQLNQLKNEINQFNKAPCDTQAQTTLPAKSSINKTYLLLKHIKIASEKLKDY